MYFVSLRVTAIKCLTGSILALLMNNSAIAHEFWIEPVQYQVEENSVLEAHLRNGENFAGSSVAHLTSQTTRFDVVTGERTDPVIARLGDNPALKMQSLQAGLNIVVHQTTDSVISYAKWDKFQRFADHKDFPDILARHRDRSLPETQFREAYTRYSKSLIAVGNSVGSDVKTDLEIELVALQNPYIHDVSDGIQVAAYYQNKIRPNAQIELYEKSADDEVAVTLHRTDDQGLVVLPVKPAHRYLVDMVVLREPSAELAKEQRVVWESLWASLTFAVP